MENVGIPSTSLLNVSKCFDDLFDDLKAIEIYELKVYAEAARGAFEASKIAISRWYGFWRLVLSPLSSFLKILAQLEFPYLKFLFSSLWDVLQKHAWPPVRALLLQWWEWEKNAPPQVWVIQGSTLATLISLWLLKRWLIRSGYLRRACRRASSLNQAFRARCAAVLRAVEQKSKMAAVLLPHVLYWVGASLGCHFCPNGLNLLSEYYAREVIGLGIPIFLTSKQLCWPSPSAQSRFSLYLMYWVLFAAMVVLHYIWSMFPTAVLEYTEGTGGHSVLLFGLWMQLPFGGIALLYTRVEPIIERYVKDLTPPAFTSGFGSILDMAVTLRMLNKNRKEMIMEILADSWLLVPCLLFLLTPSSFTYAATIYAGSLVPAYNSIRALKKSGENESSPSNRPASGEEDFLTKLKVRWLKYWCCYAVFWYVQLKADSSLWFVPLLYHMYLIWIMALQLPLLKGAERIFDFFTKSYTTIIEEVLIKTPKKTPIKAAKKTIQSSPNLNEPNTPKVGSKKIVRSMPNLSNDRESDLRNDKVD